MPSATIVEKFGLESSDELLESGSFFSEVLFGNSHQGSAVNLLSGDADAAAFDDVDVDMYFDLVEGEANTVGARYRVRDDAGDPFEAVHGKEFVIIGIAPVLIAPICFNEEALPAADREKIVAYFCSDRVANDPAIFTRRTRTPRNLGEESPAGRVLRRGGRRLVHDPIRAGRCCLMDGHSAFFGMCPSSRCARYRSATTAADGRFPR